MYLLRVTNTIHLFAFESTIYIVICNCFQKGYFKRKFCSILFTYTLEFCQLERAKIEQLNIFQLEGNAGKLISILNEYFDWATVNLVFLAMKNKRHSSTIFQFSFFSQLFRLITRQKIINNKFSSTLTRCCFP